MSRARKDKPWRLGGNNHKWWIAANHGAHGKFARQMRRAARRDFDAQVKIDEKPHRKSKYNYEYFD